MSQRILKQWNRLFRSIDLSRLLLKAAFGLFLINDFVVESQTVTTLSGAFAGYRDGLTYNSSPAQFNMPYGIAVDPKGNWLFVADYNNNALRLITHAGNRSTSYTYTFANTRQGIQHPLAVVVDSATNIFVLNTGSGTNGSVIKFSGLAANSLSDPPVFLSTNPIATIASSLVNASAMAIDGLDNLYITIRSNTVIRVSTNGAISTIGIISLPGTSLKGIAFLDNGTIALSDASNNGIWIMNPANGGYSQLTGFHGAGDTNGSPGMVAFNSPSTLAKAGAGIVLVADVGNNKMKLVDTISGIVTPLYGIGSKYWYGSYLGWSDGTVAFPESVEPNVQARQPYGVVVVPDGSVYTTEVYYQIIRQTTGTGLTGPKTGYPPFYGSLTGLAFDSSANSLFVADQANNAVQVLNLANNTTSTYLTTVNGITNPASVLLDPDDNLYVLNQNGGTNGSIVLFDSYGNSYGSLVTGLNQPTAFTMDGYGNLFVAELAGKIKVLTTTDFSSTIVTITNGGVQLQGIAVLDNGNLAVSDAGNHVIWTVNPITKAVSRLTGQFGSPGAAVGTNRFAQLNQPHQLARSGSQLVVADYGNNRLALVNSYGTVTTNSFNSGAASLWYGNPNDPLTSNNSTPMVGPFGIAVSSSGSVFVSEPLNKDIRGLEAPIAAPSTSPIVNLPNFGSPSGMAFDSFGNNLFIADTTADAVEMLNLSNNITSSFLDVTSGLNQPVDVALDSSDDLYVLNQGTGGNGSILEFDKYGNFLGTTVSGLSLPTAMRLSFSGDFYIAEMDGTVQKFNSSGLSVQAVIHTNANVQLQGIALLDNGSLVVSDAGNHVLWKIAPGATNAVLFTGVVGTSGANFGAAGLAKLNKPMRLAQAIGGLLLIADSGNNRLVVADDLGTISSALNSTNATVWFGGPLDPVNNSSSSFVSMVSPVGVAIGNSGTVFASESTYKDIRGLLSTSIVAPTPPPTAPLNLVATVTYAQVSLTWTTVTGATNYNIKRASSTNATFAIIGNTSTTGFTDANVIGGSTNYYVVSAVNGGGESPNSTWVAATPLITPPPAPRIGWYNYVENNDLLFVTVLHPISIATFNNDQLLAIDPVTDGVSTHYTTDGSTPSATNGASPPHYHDNLTSTQPLPAFNEPNLILNAISIDSIGQVSPVTTAEFIFQAGNPTITGNNAAQFTISDITTNAVFWYTIDGTDPTNAAPSFGPITSTNGFPVTLSINVSTNIIFKARAFRAGYEPSGVSVQSFSSSNFVANVISFGFVSGEASSDFVASPGQYFYAPVTLSVLPAVQIYSLQFNLTVTNFGVNPVAPGAIAFQSMLMKPYPNHPNIYLPIPTYAFVSTNPPPVYDPNLILYDGNYFQNLQFTNISQNLLGVGWVARAGETNLYNTLSQNLITYSLAHDVLYPSAAYPGQVEVGGYAFSVPATATTNDVYQIQIGRPSATADGIGAPGSDVYLDAPINTNFLSGGSLNALKNVTIGQRKYVAGSVYPFRWFNAGDFGSTNIVNADVEQVFQSAIYGLNTPPFAENSFNGVGYTNVSDFFDAMDSCGSIGVADGDNNDPNFTYLTNSLASLSPAQLSVLFDGNDTTINQIAFGDGNLDVCDVYVTYRRSLDSSLTWFRRFWNNGQRVADTGAPNVAAHALAKTTSTAAQSKAQSVATIPPQVNFSAGDIVGSAGQTVQVPINATIFGSYPLRVLMLNLTVTPLDGSPALASAVQFVPNSALGTPYTTDSNDNGNYSGVWLDSTIAGLTGTASLGTLYVTIPANATGNAAYAIHFDHASGSPNGIASFLKQTWTGLVLLSSRTNSTYGDGIPDSWRLRWFGTVNNLLSVSNACPTGDGVNNWNKYVAGVSPNTAGDFPSLNPKAPVPSGYASAVHWPTVSGKQYVILRSNSLFAGKWTAIGTNTGTGTDMEFDDTTGGSTKFYRVQILP